MAWGGVVTQTQLLSCCCPAAPAALLIDFSTPQNDVNRRIARPYNPSNASDNASPVFANFQIDK